MSIPRRGFVKSGLLSAVSAGIVLSNPGLLFSQSIEAEGGAAAPVLSVDPVFAFSRSTFESYVGDIFTAPNALGGKIELELIRVDGYQVQSDTKIMTRKVAQPETFSLGFTSREQLPPFTSIHRLSHPRLGIFGLFLTSTQNEDGTFTHEAVISHL